MCSVRSAGVAVAVLLLAARLDATCPSLSGARYAILGPLPSAGNHFGGGDPLEAYGGIANLTVDGDDTFHSELVVGGQIRWRTTTADRDGIVQYGYPRLDYYPLAFALGTSATQNFKTWALTSFDVSAAGRYFVSCGSVLSYFLDDRELVGDPYAISSWWGPNGWLWLPVNLTQGIHTIRLKFRSSFQCRVKCPGEVSALYVLSPDAPSDFNPGLVNILPSIVDGILASPYLSIPVVNAHAVATTSVRLSVLSFTVDGLPFPLDDATVGLLTKGSVHPGQVYPLPISLKLPPLGNCALVSLTLGIDALFEDGLQMQLLHEVRLRCLTFDSETPYTVSFLDVDGSVQYGVARPPPEPCDVTCSVILALHGSDVDAGSPTWAPVIPTQKNAWILLPSNRDKYGYDWQGIGQWSAMWFLQSFIRDLPGVKEKSKSHYRIDPYRLIFTGHSMGGHGCLSFAVHFPDHMLSALCAAAWIRFDHYVQEFAGSQSSHMDTVLKGILESAVAEYHTDLFVPNMKGIPFMGRMGGQDSDVCPWNLRRFARLVDEVNGKPGFAVLSEIPRQGHWFDGVMSDETFQQFMKTSVASPRPSLPSQFEVRMQHLGSRGRGGIRVLQFQTPSLLGRIEVEVVEVKTWVMTTSNVRRFSMEPLPETTFPKRCIVDGQTRTCPKGPGKHFCHMGSSKRWEICEGQEWKSREQHFEAAGPMRQIFCGPVSFIYGTQKSEDAATLADLAVHAANLLMARGHSLVHIYPDTSVPESALTGHIVLFGGPEWNAFSSKLLNEGSTSLQSTCSFESSVLEICGQMFVRSGVGAALLAIYRSSDSSPQLMTLVTGTDIAGLKNAATLLPTAPNAEIPDYVVVDQTFPWKGSGSISAAGYWGNFWECRPDISYPRRGPSPNYAS